MTKVLTEADAAADLAGLPRPVSSEDALRQAESHAAVAETILEASPRIVPSLRAKLHTNTAIMLHALVSERDGLAGRVAELEAERDAAAEVACGAVRKAFSLGQTYWQQADSEYTSQHRKAEGTWATFKALIEETRAALSNTPESKP